MVLGSFCARIIVVVNIDIVHSLIAPVVALLVLVLVLALVPRRPADDLCEESLVAQGVCAGFRLLRCRVRASARCSSCCFGFVAQQQQPLSVGGAADVVLPLRVALDGFMADDAVELACFGVLGVGMVDAAGCALLAEQSARRVGHGFAEII